MFRVITDEGKVRGKEGKLVIFKSLSKAVTVAAELRKQKYRGVRIVTNYFLIYGKHKCDEGGQTNSSSPTK